MNVARGAATVLAFVVLATANSGGYRYGVSDQAFYQPAIARALTPDAFPKDAPLLEAQTTLMLGDEALALASRVTGIALPPLFFGVYVLSVVALAVAAAAFARSCGFSPVATTALLVLLTFRHRIARTGANSLEGYMHPRMLAFAFGLAAFAAVVRGRAGWAIAGLGAAALLHPTTALWFGLAAIVALAIDRPDWRRRLWAPALVVVAAGLWAVSAGPLAGRLRIMDPAWLAVLAEKDYLFPTDWPLYAWAMNLAYLPLIIALHRVRQRAGVARPGERAIVLGLGVLFLAFLIAVPLTWMQIALAVQLQVTRVFWVMDVVLAAYLAWWLIDHVAARRAGLAWTIVAVLAAASAARGIYLLTVAQPDRQLVRVGLPADAWTDVLGWIAAQPRDWHVLADPEHGWREGVSVRVGAARDTVLETGKDTALAMYDRDIAMRVGERMQALSSFGTMDEAALRATAARYDVDVAIVDAARALALPVLYRNDRFVVYDLR